ncbi:hypothetical protein K8O92_16165 [Nocardia asteroides]|nr:hypothetical protein K8O92_16165 [Nocardia asteroides]
MVAIDFERTVRGARPVSVRRSIAAQGLGGVPPTILVLAGIMVTAMPSGRLRILRT